ncbi:putative oxidoreductase [Phaeomoniella chlamydospora]|uniref:Putative oxidoreductase n=1 Tax=Phaeomoniella chlamydospora TaxID=158046 RepID=A0A0G2EC80_PHACM|nr:putative oxidoreductase [Phaeomoniella chlamydospora]
MSSSAFKTIAVAGATGNVGPATVDALLDAGFNVVVLTRIGSTSTPPTGAGVTVKPVDYTSQDSLVAALQGVQGVVSLLGGPGFALQNALVDASVKAGVLRFIPSEFGSDTLHPKTAAFPVFAEKIKTHKYLEHVVGENKAFSCTGILTGPFTDFGFKVGLLADVKKRSISLVDGGDKPFSSTPIPEVAKAIVGVFRNPEATKNKDIYVQSYVLTQNQILRLCEKVTGSKWSVENEDSKELEAKGWAELEREKPDPMFSLVSFLRAAIFDGEHGSDFTDKKGNDLVGLKELSETDLEAELRKRM